MFGTLRPTRAALDCSGRTDWQHFYCGTCQGIGAQFGLRYRGLLSHDAVFVGLLVDALQNDPAAPDRTRCPMLPVVHRPTVSPSSVAMRYAAAVQLLLAEQWLADRAIDGRKLARVALPLVREPATQARSTLDALGCDLAELIDFEHRQAAIEVRGRTGPETAAEPTAAALELVFERIADAAGSDRGIGRYRRGRQSLRPASAATPRRARARGRDRYLPRRRARRSREGCSHRRVQSLPGRERSRRAGARAQGDRAARARAHEYRHQPRRAAAASTSAGARQHPRDWARGSHRAGDHGCTTIGGSTACRPSARTRGRTGADASLRARARGRVHHRVHGRVVSPGPGRDRDRRQRYRHGYGHRYRHRHGHRYRHRHGRPRSSRATTGSSARARNRRARLDGRQLGLQLLRRADPVAVWRHRRRMHRLRRRLRTLRRQHQRVHGYVLVMLSRMRRPLRRLQQLWQCVFRLRRCVLRLWATHAPAARAAATVATRARAAAIVAMRAPAAAIVEAAARTAATVATAETVAAVAVVAVVVAVPAERADNLHKIAVTMPHASQHHCTADG